MGAYSPNPLAIEAVKGVAYGTFGWAVRRRSEHQRSALVFGIARVALGWPVGAALFALAAALPSSQTVAILLYAALAVARFGVWSFLIDRYFRPLDGPKAVRRWALAGVLVSMLTDVAASALTELPGLRLGWC